MQELTLKVSDTERRRLEEFLTALRTSCVATVNETSSLVNSKFATEFQSKLLTQHCFIGSPLFQQNFDTAFIDSCVTAGHRVAPATDGQRFWDVEINGKKISLKTKVYLSNLC